MRWDEPDNLYGMIKPTATICHVLKFLKIQSGEQGDRLGDDQKKWPQWPGYRETTNCMHG